jgi:hypothetical protein
MERDADAIEAGVRLMEQLTERLNGAETLSADLRLGLQRADAPAIEAATARLETLVLELRVLLGEYRRLFPAGGAVPADERLASARAGLEASAARLVRSQAMASGLLERMVTLHRGLLGILAAASGEPYQRSGAAPLLAPPGLRLRERA